MIKTLFCLLSVSTTLTLFAFEGIPSSEERVKHGNSLANSGNYFQALDELNQAIAADPGNVRAYKIRGHVYYAMGDQLQALNDLNRVVSLAPTSANAYVDRAIAYSQLGNHGQALVDIERALSLKPDSAFAQAARTRILENAHAK